MVALEERHDGTDDISVFDKVKTSKLIVNTGDGSGELKGAGMVYSNYTSTGNVTTGNTVLGTYTITANSMPADSGKTIRMIAWGKTAANGNNKTITLEFGGTTVATHALAATNDKDWVLEATIIQGATGAQTAIGELKLEGASQDLQFVTTPAETQTGAIAARVRAESGTATDDILLKGMVIEFLN